MDLLKKILETKKVAQDKDIKDREGTQPSKYFKGVSKKSKAARDAHFKKGAKMDDDNPAAYKPAPGDAGAETKPSQHTKKFKRMFGEKAILNKRNIKDKKALQKAYDLLSKKEKEFKSNSAYVSLMNRLYHTIDDFDASNMDNKAYKELQRDVKKVLGRDYKEIIEENDFDLDDLDEGKLVASIDTILTAMTNKWRKKAEIEYKKNPEKGLSYIQRLGSIIGAKVTDKSQQKNHLFLRMGDELAEAKIDKKKIQQKLSKIKGLTKDQLATLSAMSPSTLQIIINQLSTLVMGDDIDESLWANIHNKRKRGEKMRKPGEKGAPKPGDFERARGEEIEERLADKLRQKEKSNQKAHQQRMMKLAKQSIKKNRKEDVEEDRDYKKEYENYHSKPEQIKRRQKRNEARRSLKNFKDIKGKDVHHKDNNPMNNDKSNLSIVSQNYNRKEPRLRESTKEYGKSLRKIALDRQLKNISKKDKATLLKIADLLAKEKKWKDWLKTWDISWKQVVPPLVNLK